ncbi:hypothetical protein FACS1894216_17820 [Synergistales bacterium]|nr:hypothetical protein FACS1894216_17820 [Synergistales bacterium]
MQRSYMGKRNLHGQNIGGGGGGGGDSSNKIITGNILTLGHQGWRRNSDDTNGSDNWKRDNLRKFEDWLYITFPSKKDEIRQFLTREKNARVNGRWQFDNGIYADDMLKIAGAERVDSLDYSDFEGATIIHNLCDPVPEDLKNKFDLVWDAGTLEHVYDFPVAIRSLMEMTKIGGHCFIWQIGNNALGHGFYQFSPELFFSLFRECNGFTGTRIFTEYKNRLYEFKNPREVRRRCEFQCFSRETKDWVLLRVITQKIAEVPQTLNVLQSDYEMAWNNGETAENMSAAKNPKTSALKDKLKQVYHKMPSALRHFVWRVLYTRNVLYTRRKEMENLMIDHGKLL